MSSIKGAEYNAPCVENSECHSYYTKSYSCVNDHCIHNSFEFNTWKEWVGMFTIIVISTLANAGGLGAGAVIIPVYIFIYDFAPTDSIPLSKITIFAGAIASVMLSACSRREDDKNSLLINYEMATTMIPLLLIGTMIGVLLSKILPPVAITGCLCLYLFFSTYKMCTKAIEITKKENAKRRLVAENAELMNSPTKPLDDSTLNDQSAKKEFLSKEESDVVQGDGMITSNEELQTQAYDVKTTDIDTLSKSLYHAKEVTCCQHLKKQLPNLGLLLLSFMVV